MVRLNKSSIVKYVLLFYSILPAFAKISGLNLFYALYIPLLGVLHWTYWRRTISLYKTDIPFLLMFSIALIYIPISIFLYLSSLKSVLYGALMFLLPMTGYFFSRLIPINVFSKSIIFVGLIHAIFGILTYGFIQFPFSIQALIETIKKGTMAFRMSSVSGSLGLGALMLVSFAFSLIKLLQDKNKANIITALLLFFALIMTMQRSAWIGASFYFFLVFIYMHLNTKNIFSKKNIYLFFSVLLIVGIIISQYIDLNIRSFVISRIYSISGEELNPVSERSFMWLGGVENFLQVPSGLGLGTTGQAARVGNFTSSYHVVTDGDYFRILSELGIGALFFYLYLFTFIFIGFFNLRNMSIERFAAYLVVIGLSINMIGSNTTEFHFVNFLYWMSLGYLFNKILLGNNNAFIYNS